MRKIICDKCGKEIQEDKNRLYKVYKDNCDEPVPFDYCDVCYPQLAAWIMTNSPLNTTDPNMTVRQILEKFEKWYVKMWNSSFVYVNSKVGRVVFENDRGKSVFAIDEFLKEEGIEE